MSDSKNIPEACLSSPKDADPVMAEYLRRNLNVARAVGAISLIEAALFRLEQGTKRPPKWLVEKLRGATERMAPLPRELAAYRGKPPK